MQHNNLDVQRFKVSDWYDIDPREENKEDLETLKSNIEWEKLYLRVPFFTYRHEGEIIMIYGMIYAGCGTYTPAIILSKHAKKYKISIIKLLYAYYNEYTRTDVRRLEAQCDVQDAEAIRLAKHFGFDIIGIRHMAAANWHDQVVLERLVLHDARKIGDFAYGG